jgi:hypothetical protein
VGGIRGVRRWKQSGNHAGCGAGHHSQPSARSRRYSWDGQCVQSCQHSAAQVSEGFVEQLDDIFAFHLPRPDESSISIAGERAEAGLGVGQSFYIQVPFSGGSNVTLDVDFALRPEEVQPVEDTLRAGGFTISSQSNHYLHDNPHLQFVHATASGDGFTIGSSLYDAIQIIRADSRRH